MLPFYYVVIKMLLLSVGGIIAIAILIMICGNVAMFYPDVAIVGRWWWHRCNGSDNNLRQRSTQLLSLALPLSSIMV